MFKPLFLDVMIGPTIAIVIGLYFLVPTILIGLLIFLTVKLIKKLKKKQKEDET